MKKYNTKLTRLLLKIVVLNVVIIMGYTLNVIDTFKLFTLTSSSLEIVKTEEVLITNPKDVFITSLTDNYKTIVMTKDNKIIAEPYYSGAQLYQVGLPSNVDLPVEADMITQITVGDVLVDIESEIPIIRQMLSIDTTRELLLINTIPSAKRYFELVSVVVIIGLLVLMIIADINSILINPKGGVSHGEQD